ncbi:MAG TPA: hypothetical protein ENG27_02150 [Candidatus Bathyarchaeota archaeon]|nr:hypothetical protein [Candidatus Bathyarchaeota archaeon]
MKPHPVLRLVLNETDETVCWVKVADDSKLVGMKLNEARIPEETGMWILAIKRGDQFIRPKPDTRIDAGDILIATGYSDGREELRELASPSVK